jgi:hypothetical protein
VPGRIAPGALGNETVNEGGGTTGHGVAFCVRLCDGHHFPMENMVKGTNSRLIQLAYYSSSVQSFIAESPQSVIGVLAKHHPHDIDVLRRLCGLYDCGRWLVAASDPHCRINVDAGVCAYHNTQRRPGSSSLLRRC